MKWGRNREAAMEIAPIPGIRAMSAVRSPRIESWRPSVFDIDASAKPEDGRGQGSGKKAAGAEEEGEDEEFELAGDGEMGARGETGEEGPGRSVDYFA
jgi:hypothetical protein